MAGKQVTELDALPSFTDNSLLPVHNGAGLKKGLLSQLASYLGSKFSNPNLLINPDFEINQRGLNSYTSDGYTVDRWRVASSTLNATTKTLSNPNREGGTLLQYLEGSNAGTFTLTLNAISVTGTVYFSWKDGATHRRGATITKGINTYTFSASSLTCVGIEVATGASVQLSYMKLEQGAVATSFIAPNYAEEILKCQRYLIYAPSCMVGFRYDKVVYVSLENLKKMRINGSCSISGVNNDTDILYNGSTQQGVSIDASQTSVSKDRCFLRIGIKNMSTAIKNTVLGIDMNNTFILIDAEIY